MYKTETGNSIPPKLFWFSRLIEDENDALISVTSSVRADQIAAIEKITGEGTTIVMLNEEEILSSELPHPLIERFNALYQ